MVCLQLIVCKIFFTQRHDIAGHLLRTLRGIAALLGQKSGMGLSREPCASPLDTCRKQRKTQQARGMEHAVRVFAMKMAAKRLSSSSTLLHLDTLH